MNPKEIGVSVHHTTNTETSKQNLDIPDKEEEHRYQFPELRPSRAVLDIETGTLFEIMHRPVGHVDTVEGLKTEKDEWFDETYRTKKGQNWGGIIQHHFIEFAKRDCPEPNEHSEIPVPVERPTDENVTDMNPESFFNSQLTSDDFSVKPLVLLERPEVSYEEIFPGDTYETIGWYDPSVENPDNRIRQIEQMGTQFPEITNQTHNKTNVHHIPSIDVSVAATELEKTDTARLSLTENGCSLTAAETRDQYHITVGTLYDDFRFLIDSPFEARETINSLSGQPRWEPEQEIWGVQASSETFTEIISSLSEHTSSITLSRHVIEHFGTKGVEVTVDGDVEPVSIEDALSYIFVEEVVVDSTFVIPGLPELKTPDSIDSEFVEFEAGDDSKSTVSYVDNKAENHIANTDSDSVKVFCPEQSGSIVKTLNWKESRYEWNNSIGGWKISQNSTNNLIKAFLDAGCTVTVATDVISSLGEENAVTDQRKHDVDSTSVIDYDKSGFSNPGETLENELREHNSNEVTRTIHGFVPNNPESITLGTLDIVLGDGMNGAISIDTGGLNADIPELAPSVKDQWQSALEVDKTEFAWYHPRTSARVTVNMDDESNNDSFGKVDYHIKVKSPYTDSPEHVVTVNDERAAVMAVITHLEALSH